MEPEELREINSYVLEHRPDQMYPRNYRGLSEIFASTLATGEVPKDWKVTNIALLFKKGCMG